MRWLLSLPRQQLPPLHQRPQPTLHLFKQQRRYKDCMRSICLKKTYRRPSNKPGKSKTRQNKHHPKLLRLFCPNLKRRLLWQLHHRRLPPHRLHRHPLFLLHHSKLSLRRRPPQRYRHRLLHPHLRQPQSRLLLKRLPHRQAAPSPTTQLPKKPLPTPQQMRPRLGWRRRALSGPRPPSSFMT